MPSISVTPWGNSPAGPVERFTLTNDSGNSISVLSYGAIIQSIRMDGQEMILGYDDLSGYLGEYPYYGALVGRYGNRIAGARFALDGTTYVLDANENANQLHGGSVGFNRHPWQVEQTTTEDSATVMLSRISPDGEMGFPGNLRVSCSYAWTNDNTLRIHYTATTDKDTIVNLTNHAYFSIGGGGRSVLDQMLRLDADRYTPVDAQQIPTGQLTEVAGTPFDFRVAKAVGKDIASDHPQIARAGGYDHNWAINGYDGSLREFALLSDPVSGRSLRCFTTEPGVQVFTTNFTPGEFTVRDGAPVQPHTGICLETQHFPDSPNQANFQTPLLKVGDTYNTTTVYRFE
ncbi:Aldose 1-epimerase [Neolewinella maritima]|uniref:Aldose 1-epimerase n=1 Tax=Neolewinella maritima TaxID=1383882 RepID=A0ABM9B5F8_9BACT|nr:aldose epimerase family protein [Neolewinella maritima]CAH1002426.1 Aldose 1-epimerase [Neolewinella maritima]